MAQSSEMTQAAGLLVEREVRIAASPETIFEFFVDEGKALQWMGVKAELDPRAGGIYRVHVSPDWVARGEFVAIEPHTRVAFTWGWENNPEFVAPGSTLIEITLESDGDETIVRLRHSGFSGPEGVGSHGEGWTHFLDRLRIAAAGGDPGPDPWANAGAES